MAGVEAALEAALEAGGGFEFAEFPAGVGLLGCDDVFAVVGAFSARDFSDGGNVAGAVAAGGASAFAVFADLAAADCSDGVTATGWAAGAAG